MIQRWSDRATAGSWMRYLPPDGTTARLFRTNLIAPTCEERLLRPDRKGDLELWTDWTGRVFVRVQQSQYLNPARAFYSLALRETSDGTQIEVRSDIPLPAKVAYGAMIVLASLGALGGCLGFLLGLGTSDCVNRAGGAAVGILFLVCVLAIYAGARWPQDGDQTIVEDILREELGAVLIENVPPAPAPHR